jgi:hypothetical protein
MGGAFGSTIAGALLAAGFASRLAAEGVKQAIDLGALRGHQSALAALSPAVAGTARQALGASFAVGFLACAVVTALGLLVALAMRDLPLRSGES